MSAIFHQAVLDGDVTKVRFLLKYSPGMRVNHPSKDGLTALQQAAWDGNINLVNFLLENGADMSLVDTEGYTALHLAAQEGHLGVVSLLVNSACVSVNAKTNRGQRAVDVARTEQVRALLSQAMLTESFKRKCSLGSDNWETNGSSYKNVPGCRYSLSSASTDSGVYDDSSSSLDSQSDPKYSRYLNRGSGIYGYNRSSIYTTSSSSEGCECDGSTQHRRADGSTVTSILKSQSFSVQHEGEREEEQHSSAAARLTRHDSARSEMERYRRPQKSYVRDLTRRRTVTFGEMEEDSVYRDCYTPPLATHSRSRQPPPVPPRISTLPRNCDEQRRGELSKYGALTTAHERSPSREEITRRDPRNRRSMVDF